MSLLKVIAQRHRTVPAKLDWNPASGAFASTIGPTPVFSRASAATMIDVTGKVVWGPENLLTYSQDFTNAVWQPFGTTASANAINAPDGSLTAEKIVESAANAEHGWNLGGTMPLGLMTFSIYVKPSGRTELRIEMNAANTIAHFNLTGAGSVTLSQPGITATRITALPDGWYRCEYVIVIAPGTTFFLKFINAAASTYLGDGTSGIYVWGAQLEKGPVARTYLPTTTAPVYGPRITYDPISHQCLGYLAEEQRTNLAWPSEDFTLNTRWGTNGPTAALNTHTAPSGTLSADTITGSADIYLLFSAAAAGDHCFSVYVRKTTGTARWIGIGHYTATYAWSVINPTTGVVGSNAAGNTCTVVDFGSFWRVIVKRNILVGNNYFVIHPSFNDDGSQVSSAVSGSVVVWGAQIEVGSFPTSYIPTTTAAVTRSADLCSISGTDFTGFYNQTEGTAIAKAALNIPPGVPAIIAFVGFFSDGTGSNYIDVARYQPGLKVLGATAGAGQFNIDSVQPAGSQRTSAVAVKVNDVSLVVDGALVGSDTVVTLPVVNQLEVGASNGSYRFNGTIARIQYFPTRLPNAKLIELTRPTLKLTTHGDSITRDQGANNYSFILAAKLGAELSQNGTNGISYNYDWPDDPGVGTMTTQGPGLDAAIPDRPENMLVVFAGTNGMVVGGHTVATEIADFEAYIAARIAGGWNPAYIYVVPMLPRSGMPYGTNNQFNDLLDNLRVVYGYKFVRKIRSSAIGVSGADLNTALFYDGTHPTPAGHQIIADTIYDAIYPATVQGSLAAASLAGEASGFALYAADNSVCVKDAANPFRNFNGLATDYILSLIGKRQLDGSTWRFHITTADNCWFPLNYMPWNATANTVFTSFDPLAYISYPVTFGVPFSNIPGAAARMMDDTGVQVYTSSGSIFISTTMQPAKITHTLAVRWADNNAGASGDGVAPTTSSSGLMITGLTEVLLGQGPGHVEKNNMWIDAVVILPRAASNAELQNWIP